ncbi:MAG: hypothetical protein PHH83_01455 [Patescibacteria group bacterium]|nr:hypothetical protein [Patescibacteria group bacterium]
MLIKKRWNDLWDKLLENVTQVVRKRNENVDECEKHIDDISDIIEEINSIKKSSFCA